MKILVTGGTGFIGSHTVVELQKKGYEVIIIDNLSNSNENVIDSIKAITGARPTLEVFDLSNSYETGVFFKKYTDIFAVIHFAAFKVMNESVNNPLAYYDNNLNSLLNILKEMNANKIYNIVFSSSCSVYGRPKETPVSEDAPIQIPSSPYGNTKQICEEIIADLVKVSKIKAINLRYFNPAGAHNSALIGELPIGVPTNLIPFITQTAVGLHKYLKVYGNDYKTPDGTAIRDYIHVVDVAKAHVIAVERMINEKIRKGVETFNLGMGVGHSVLEVINTFEKVSGQKLNYKYVDRREGDVDRIWADSRLSNKVLCWEAKLTLDQILKSALEWEVAYRALDND